MSGCGKYVSMLFEILYASHWSCYRCKLDTARCAYWVYLPNHNIFATATVSTPIAVIFVVSNLLSKVGTYLVTIEVGRHFFSNSSIVEKFLIISISVPKKT